MVDLAIERVAAEVGLGPAVIAVNAHYRAAELRQHLVDRVTLSDEQPVALGTAGAVGALRDWIDGRDVLLTNSDSYLPAGMATLASGWDGRRIRLLCMDVGEPSDFGELRYVGACLLPGPVARELEPTPSGLYEVLWRSAYALGDLDLVTTAPPAIDCGTPRDYLAANLHASGGAAVIDPEAVVEGSVERSVVWAGAWVGPDEHLVDCIRAGDRDRPVTVRAT